MRILDMPEFKDKTQVLTFSKDTTIADAVDAMSKKNYGAVLITEDKKLLGVFTERDLLRRVAASRIDIEKTSIGDVMSTNVKTAKTDEKVADCLRRMSQGRFRHLPIIDDKDELQGMLSQGDFVAFTMSDAIYRAGASAKADIFAGKSTPFSIIAAIFVYTVGLLFILSALGHWAG